MSDWSEDEGDQQDCGRRAAAFAAADGAAPDEAGMAGWKAA